MFFIHPAVAMRLDRSLGALPECSRFRNWIATRGSRKVEVRDIDDSRNLGSEYFSLKFTPINSLREQTSGFPRKEWHQDVGCGLQRSIKIDQLY